MSATLHGVEAVPTLVEVALCNGLPGMHIVGMGDTAVQEARERVRSAMQACGYVMPNRKIVVNLAPGNIKKTGSGFDLPIALGILGASGQIDKGVMRDKLFIGELSLDGFVRAVPGYLAFALGAKEAGVGIVSALGCAVPLVETEQFGLASLGRLRLDQPFNEALSTPSYSMLEDAGVDFRDISGHEVAKRALQIAVAGRHGVLMIGPPGSGKTMLASRMSTIMAPLTQDEILETAVIHSVANESVEPIMHGQRPFRDPHHSVTTAGLIGGGTPVRPGEISLAHHGTLFLDELAEFRSSTLQALRQPLESGEVLLTRADSATRFPADFMLVAASNPCPCGYFGDKEHACSCSEFQIQRYRAKIGGPLLDRIDIQLHVDRIPAKDVLRSGDGMSSAAMREGVLCAQRFASWRRSCKEDDGSGIERAFSLIAGKRLSSRQVIDACKLDDETRAFICEMADLSKMSGRALISLLKVGRTIADMEESIEVRTEHVAEALCFKVDDSAREPS